MHRKDLTLSYRVREVWLAVGKYVLSAAFRFTASVRGEGDSGITLLWPLCMNLAISSVDRHRNRSEEVLCPAGSSPPLPFHLPSRLPLLSSASATRKKKKRRSFDIICSINSTFCLSAPPSLWSSSINKTTHRTLYQAGSGEERQRALWKQSLCFCLWLVQRRALQPTLPWSNSPLRSTSCQILKPTRLYFGWLLFPPPSLGRIITCSWCPTCGRPPTTDWRCKS